MATAVVIVLLDKNLNTAITDGRPLMLNQIQSGLIAKT